MAGSAYIYAVALCSPLIIYALSQIVRFVRWFTQVRRIKAVLDGFVAAEKPHWLYGHTKYITGPNETTMMKYVDWTEKDKRGAFSISLGPSSWLVVCHPSSAKQILATAEPKGVITYCESSYKYITPWLGDGLLTSKGDKWLRNRRLLTPAFHFDILKPYMKIYNSCTEKLVESLKQLSQENGSIDVVPLISLCTLNVMRKCAFSAHDDIQVDGGKELPYVKAVTEIGDLVMARFFNPLLSPDIIYNKTKGGKSFLQLVKFSHEVAKDVIKKRKEEIPNSEKPTGRYVDFLDILLLAKDEDGKGLTDAEILDEVETFMFEGHDTTASAISWILYNFARHPEIQQKASLEIESVLPEPDQPVEWDDLSKIPYTTRCIKESMRIHPPVPVILRELSKPLQIAGTTLLAGTIIEINKFAIHHNPKVWGVDHMTFDPDRFLPDNMAKMDSHAYIPFSAGPRNCIGQNFAMNEIKTSVMQILKRFHLSLDEEHKVEMIPSMVLRSADGIKLHFNEYE